MRKTAIAALLGLALSGCASATDPRDPIEPFNRAMYQFNDAADKIVLTPVSSAYRYIIPDFGRDMIGNFFSNLGDTVVIVSDILQGKYIQTLSDISRVGWNSTLGIFGLFDVATHLDLPKHNDDLGMAFGSWGIGHGAYLVIPFIGPSSVRDGIGWFSGLYINPLYTYYDIPVRNSGIALRYVNEYASLYGTGALIEEAALDPYIFVREAYFQRRASLVGGGAPTFTDDDPGADPAPSSP